MVKNLPAMQETWVGSLGWEDTLEEGIATHSNILVWRIPQTEEPGGLQSIGSQKSWTQLNQLSMQAHTYINTHIKIVLTLISYFVKNVMSIGNCFTCASLISIIRTHGLCLISFIFDTVSTPLLDQ